MANVTGEKMSKPSMETYYPKDIEVKVLKNKIYLLSYTQHDRLHEKILTKAACIRFANDMNTHKDVRAAIIEAFKEGVIE